MRASFRGQSVQKLDSKGRVSIPASFRDELMKESGGTGPQRFILVFGQTETRGYLEGYSPAGMARLERKIRKLPQFSDARENAEEIFINNSVEMEIDVTGRIVLPQALRGRLGDTEELLFLGQLDTFRIKTPTAAEAERAARAARMVPGDPGSDPYAALGALMMDEDDE